MPATCYFRLNGKRVSTLDCLDFGSVLAFSGNDQYTNDPKSTHVARNGPLPHGTYYIVDRQSGGRHGKVLDGINDVISGTQRDDWFALYTTTPPIGDSLIIKGVRRSSFRIHPVGYWGISEGCITLRNLHDFHSLRKWLKSLKTSTIPGTDIPYYGTVTVL